MEAPSSDAEAKISSKRSRSVNESDDGSSEEKYIILNVGGKRFYTARSTLVTEPDSMLGAMFSGKYALSPSPSDGSHFIDRDPTLFHLVLNFLRSRKLTPDLTEKELRALELEAQFYSLDSLREAITGEMEASKERLQREKKLNASVIFDVIAHRDGEDDEERAEYSVYIDDRYTYVLPSFHESRQDVNHENSDQLNLWREAALQRVMFAGYRVETLPGAEHTMATKFPNNIGEFDDDIRQTFIAYPIAYK